MRSCRRCQTGQSGNALEMYDDNGNGRITCAEARAHGIAPVPRARIPPISICETATATALFVSEEGRGGLQDFRIANKRSHNLP